MEKKEKSIVKWLYFIKNKVNELDERLSEIENALSDEDIDIEGEYFDPENYTGKEFLGVDQLA